jgi:hypothetical protein
LLVFGVHSLLAPAPRRRLRYGGAGSLRDILLEAYSTMIRKFHLRAVYTGLFTLDCHQYYLRRI